MRKPFLNSISSIFLILFCITLSANAQRLYLCKAVTPEGDPMGLSQFFKITQENISISALVKLYKHSEVEEVEFRIYRVLADNSEVIISSVPFKIEHSWLWFWKELKFSEPGAYKIYLYMNAEKPLCSETLDIYKE